MKLFTRAVTVYSEGAPVRALYTTPHRGMPTEATFGRRHLAYGAVKPDIFPEDRLSAGGVFYRDLEDFARAWKATRIL